MARYKMIKSIGLVARWEKAVALNPKVSYSDPEFMQPMRWVGGGGGGGWGEGDSRVGSVFLMGLGLC